MSLATFIRENSGPGFAKRVERLLTGLSAAIVAAVVVVLVARATVLQAPSYTSESRAPANDSDVSAGGMQQVNADPLLSTSNTVPGSSTPGLASQNARAGRVVAMTADRPDLHVTNGRPKQLFQPEGGSYAVKSNASAQGASRPVTAQNSPPAGRTVAASQVPPSDPPQTAAGGADRVHVKAYPIPAAGAAKTSGSITSTVDAAPMQSGPRANRPPWASPASGAASTTPVNAGQAPPSLNSVATAVPSQSSPAVLGSAPKSGQPIVIPNVIGMTTKEATAALRQAGLQVEHITLLHGPHPVARVVNTEPEPGATPPPGSNTVDLIVGGR